MTHRHDHHQPNLSDGCVKSFLQAEESNLVAFTNGMEPVAGMRLRVSEGSLPMLSVQMKVSAILIAASLANSALAQQYPQPTRPSGVTQATHYVPEGTPEGPVGYGQYPQLNAPLYPSPVQYTPYWNGGTIITNQALAPHEMLYPHDYHAMYPPFYYKVNGGWIWTPFGMRQHERWKLQGTTVRVKYRSEYPPLLGFFPPRHD